MFSCNTKAPTSPEGVLNHFITKRFSGAKVSELSKYVSQDFLNKMDSLSGTKYEELTNYKKGKVKVISKQCEKDGSLCKLTYYIAYSQKEGGKRAYDTETKKVANILKSGESWVIDDIHHIKTYHDMIEKLEVPSSK